MGIRRRLRRNRTALAGAAVVVLFVAALVLWIGHVGGAGSSTARAEPTSPFPLPSPSTSASSSIPAFPSGTPKSGVHSSAVPLAGSGAGLLPPLPESTDINPGPHGQHSVTISASSDKTILRMAYYIRGGTPAYNQGTYIKSPMSVTTIGTGDGLIAEIAVQASPGSKTISCQISVDGKITSHRTVTGSYAVAFCIG